MKKNKFGILIPIRLSSKRLPKKALRKTNAGKPLEILIQNLSKIVNTRKDIVVCTTKNKIDDELVKYSKILKFSIFRGDTNDIINRMYLANLKYKFDFIAEVDGDDILTDPNLIFKCLNVLKKNKLDYVYTDGLPLGLNVKVFKSKALNLTNEAKISNVNFNGFMLMFKNNILLKKKVIKFNKFRKIRARFTIDYIEDLIFFENIVKYLHNYKRDFLLDNYFYILKKHSELKKINFFRNKSYMNNSKKMKPLLIMKNKKITSIKIV
tara:strand:- start:5685 stop:6482 length:798 start_codon:yes stop_codon:yes gene_type:complete